MADPCGARTRAGGKCRAPAMANGRCRVHGGPNTGAPKGNANARKHGIYARYFSDIELQEAEELGAGAVTHELIVARIQLARALAAQEAADGKLETDEEIERAGGGAAVAQYEVKKRLRDYPGLINSLLARIESLEKTQAALQLVTPPDGSIDDIIRSDTYLNPDEPAPERPVL